MGGFYANITTCQQPILNSKSTNLFHMSFCLPFLWSINFQLKSKLVKENNDITGFLTKMKSICSFWKNSYWLLSVTRKKLVVHIYDFIKPDSPISGQWRRKKSYSVLDDSNFAGWRLSRKSKNQIQGLIAAKVWRKVKAPVHKIPRHCLATVLKVSKYQKQNTKFSHPPKNQRNFVHFKICKDFL